MTAVLISFATVFAAGLFTLYVILQDRKKSKQSTGGVKNI